ncbi:hypothetical protein B0H63DRAFT_483939 [Podospora didyma]|uniref:Uncharacterized protein n=1 Tax=Podospora didyma TaxID=330526 RepID=A0AAE0K914_9PEZI|nr:hypothetical protein B0H63DRAFT_483939 [Podospora didyma]
MCKVGNTTFLVCPAGTADRLPLLVQIHTVFQDRTNGLVPINLSAHYDYLDTGDVALLPGLVCLQCQREYYLDLEGHFREMIFTQCKCSDWFRYHGAQQCNVFRGRQASYKYQCAVGACRGKFESFFGSESRQEWNNHMEGHGYGASNRCLGKSCRCLAEGPEDNRMFYVCTVRGCRGPTFSHKCRLREHEREVHNIHRRGRAQSCHTCSHSRPRGPRQVTATSRHVRDVPSTGNRSRSSGVASMPSPPGLQQPTNSSVALSAGRANTRQPVAISHPLLPVPVNMHIRPAGRSSSMHHPSGLVNSLLVQPVNLSPPLLLPPLPANQTAQPKSPLAALEVRNLALKAKSVV